MVGINDELEQRHPWLSPDETIIVFSRFAKGGLGDLQIATRMIADEAFGIPAALGSINSPDHESRAFLSDDLMTVYFDRNAIGGDYQLLTATRSSVEADFGKASLIAGVNTKLDDYEPFVTDEGLYFGSNRENVGDLYFAPRTGAGFGPPVALAAVNSSSDEEMPVLSRDGRGLYFFATDRGADGAGVDVWVSTRTDVGEEWGEPNRLGPPVNGEGDEYPGWLSEDNCRLYFTSAVGGDTDIWVAKRAPE